MFSATDVTFKRGKAWLPLFAAQQKGIRILLAESNNPKCGYLQKGMTLVPIAGRRSLQTIFEEDEKIFQSICAGASGYILKNTSPSRYLDFIREVYEGGAPMSPSVAMKVLKIV